MILLLSRGCCRYDNEVGLPQCSFQRVPVSVIASTIEQLHSCHIIMWLSLALKVIKHFEDRNILYCWIYMLRSKCSINKHGVQWQLNTSYRLTCTPGCIAAHFNWHGNCWRLWWAQPTKTKIGNYKFIFSAAMLLQRVLQWNIHSGGLLQFLSHSDRVY